VTRLPPAFARAIPLMRRPGGSPHLVLAVGAAVVLALEALRGSATLGTSSWWPFTQALVAGVTLVAVWRARDQLRLGSIVAIGLAFHLVWIGLHLHLGVTGDHDPVDVYSSQGNALLTGDYPRSEYPPGAVAFFALATWLGGGAARTAHAFLMVPFQIVCIVGIWSLRTRWTPWLSACVALWPLNAFYWEFRFDLVPTAALLAGLVLARRGLWYEAGFVLGLGAVVKWTPGLSCIVLVLWLLRWRRFEKAAVTLVGFSIPVLLVNVPVLLWKPSELIAAYTTQNARNVTAESFVYLPLHLFWSAEPGYWYFGGADVSPHANRIAVWFQVVAVLAVIALAALARTRSSAVALAGLAPAVFFLTNRIFSPQFFVLVLAALLAATALVVRRRSELFALAGACAVSTTANTILFQSLLGVYPVADVPGWTILSAASYLPVIAATIWLVVRAELQTVETPIVAQPPIGVLAPST
jgi:Glycosyltransferase family 87